MDRDDSIIIKEPKFIPEVESKLRSKLIKVPDSIYRASGIKVLGKRIKSLIFSTDVAIIKNNNAQATIAVYPFTPQLAVMEAILNVSSVPVFTGVGGGVTPVERVVQMAMQAELKGAYGVVMNASISNEVIKSVSSILDIPIVCTVACEYDDYLGKIEAGASVLNISGGKNTAELVRKVRQDIGYEFPIIATGGPTDEHIIKTIDAGANAITYTPPTTAEIFADVMASYREKKES